MSPHVRGGPCQACPYRRDVPSGIWHPDEYAKLPPYDAPTALQPAATFHCHATPEALCHGWAVVHSERGHAFELLAQRIWPFEVPIGGTTPLFGSGTEAALHGLADVDDPTGEAQAAMARLLAKHAHLHAPEPEDPAC